VTEHQTAIVASIVAALVGVANAVFGLHLSAPDLLGIILPLIGLALAEAHIAHGQAEHVNITATLTEVLEAALKAIQDAQGTTGSGSTGG